MPAKGMIDRVWSPTDYTLTILITQSEEQTWQIIHWDLTWQINMHRAKQAHMQGATIYYGISILILWGEKCYKFYTWNEDKNEK